jgi:hypothetical protein
MWESTAYPSLKPLVLWQVSCVCMFVCLCVCVCLYVGVCVCMCVCVCNVRVESVTEAASVVAF